MKRYFTKDFYRFLMGFLAIIAVAFSVIIVASHEMVEPVDNIAQPQ